jgi:hypothetical protein
MPGEGILIDPSTEVRITGREKFCRLVVLCDGVGPPAVDGRTPGPETPDCGGGRNLLEDMVLGWPESVETKDTEESLRWEDVDCDLAPVGERGRGGGLRGGRLSWSPMTAPCYANAQ